MVKCIILNYNTLLYIMCNVLQTLQYVVINYNTIHTTTYDELEYIIDHYNTLWYN